MESATARVRPIAIRLVRDAPNHLWLGNRLVNLEDGSSVSSPEDVILSPDQRQVLFFEAGDLWRGDFDWSSGEVINKRQITDRGLLVAPGLTYGTATGHMSISVTARAG